MNRGVFTLIFFCIISSAFTQEDRSHVVIETDSGSITLALYNETPKHRDNFLKLTRDGFYDGTSFHRVIKEFMIQGGDPNSKEGVGIVPGSGGPGYKLPAEIVDSFYHKKGALCAARMGDNINPERESSGSQFYIVQGRTFNDEQLDKFEVGINNATRTKLTQAFFAAPENKEYLDRIQTAKQEGNKEEIKTILEEIDPFIDAKMEGQRFEFTPKQRKLYKETGGAPHLDMQYTVFGEVIDGIEVVDKIGSVKTKGDTPLVPIRMTVRVVE